MRLCPVQGRGGVVKTVYNPQKVGYSIGMDKEKCAGIGKIVLNAADTTH